jgi:hypothetical protein
VGSARTIASHHITVQPRHPRPADIFGGSVPEAAMRPHQRQDVRRGRGSHRHGFFRAVARGLGRVVALHHRPSTLHQIREQIRCLFSEAAVRPDPRWRGRWRRAALGPSRRRPCPWWRGASGRWPRISPRRAWRGLAPLFSRLSPLHSSLSSLSVPFMFPRCALSVVYVLSLSLFLPTARSTHPQADRRGRGAAAGRARRASAAVFRSGRGGRRPAAALSEPGAARRPRTITRGILTETCRGGEQA